MVFKLYHLVSLIVISLSVLVLSQVFSVARENRSKPPQIKTEPWSPFWNGFAGNLIY
jgi:hypothetical protein